MRKECAWCGVLMGIVGSEDREGHVSHGMCEHCLYTKYRPYYDEMKARGVLPSQRTQAAPLTMGAMGACA